MSDFIAMRAMFEVWVTVNGAWPKAIERGANGEYLLSSTQQDWVAFSKGWEARETAKECLTAKQSTTP